MRYSVAQIEDQLIATIREDTTNFGGINLIDTLAGEVNPQMLLFNPEMMQGFIKLLPFVLVSYRGRAGQKFDRDSSGKIYAHTLTFRFFTGAQSVRRTQEAVRNNYDMMAALYDDIHGRVPACTPQQLSGYTALGGIPITIPEFNPLGPFYESGGQDESLVINLPGIVVYKSDFSVRVVA